MKTAPLASWRPLLLAMALLAVLDPLRAQSVIGVNFAGVNVHGTPTVLERNGVGGVVPLDALPETPTA